jgi:hypothetical protein
MGLHDLLQGQLTFFTKQTHTHTHIYIYIYIYIYINQSVHHVLHFLSRQSCSNDTRSGTKVNGSSLILFRRVLHTERLNLNISRCSRLLSCVRSIAELVVHYWRVMRTAPRTGFLGITPTHSTLRILLLRHYGFSLSSCSGLQFLQLTYQIFRECILLYQYIRFYIPVNTTIR